MDSAGQTDQTRLLVCDNEIMFNFKSFGMRLNVISVWDFIRKTFVGREEFWKDVLQSTISIISNNYGIILPVIEIPLLTWISSKFLRISQEMLDITEEEYDYLGHRIDDAITNVRNGNPRHNRNGEIQQRIKNAELSKIKWMNVGLRSSVFLGGGLYLIHMVCIGSIGRRAAYFAGLGSAVFYMQRMAKPRYHLLLQKYKEYQAI